MKYNGNKRDHAAEGPGTNVIRTPGAPKAAAGQPSVLSGPESDAAIDRLQFAVYRSARSLLDEMDGRQLMREIPGAEKDLPILTEACEDLGRFRYCVGFAGLQSAGKSAVINSLLRYPLMPCSKRKTTSAKVRVEYSENWRIVARDELTQKDVLDIDCAGLRQQTFDRLLSYCCEAMKALLIENFRYFTDKDIFNDVITPADLELRRTEPRQVMLMLLVLLAAHVGQNDQPESWDEDTEQLMKQRESLLRSFGVPETAVNLSIRMYGAFDALRTGLVIVDLPGFGSTANGGKRNNVRIIGDDETAASALSEIDTMAFIFEPELRNGGIEALDTMVSNLRVRNVTGVSEHILAIMNQIDRCEGEVEAGQSIDNCCRLLAEHGIEKTRSEIYRYSAIAGDYRFDGVPVRRKHYYQKLARSFSQLPAAMVAAILTDELVVGKAGSDSYDISGIENLIGYFRTDFVEMGKLSNTLKLLNALQVLSTRQMAQLRAEQNRCELVMVADTEALAEVAGLIDDKVKDKIAAVCREIQAQYDAAQEAGSKMMTDGLTEVIEIYETQLKTALEAYRQKLLGIVGKFAKTAAGWGGKACIDTSHVENHRLYGELQKEVRLLPVDIKPVNAWYEKQLNGINRLIVDMFAKGVASIKKLRELIEKDIDRILADHEEEHLALMKRDIMAFIDAQLKVIELGIGENAGRNEKLQQSIAQAFIRLNNKVVCDYVLKVVQNLMQGVRPGGFFFSEHNYLQIDDRVFGNAMGIRPCIEGLSFTDTDRDAVKLNVEADVAAEIQPQVDEWIASSQAVLVAYTNLSEALDNQLKDYSARVEGNSAENAQTIERLKALHAQWRALLADFRASAQDSIVLASSYLRSAGRQDQLAEYRSDVLAGLGLDIEGEADA